MKKHYLLFFLLLLAVAGTAQEKKFTVQGSPIVTLYANYHAGLGPANKESGFELDRSYLGYQFSVTQQLSGRVIFDIGPIKVKGSDLERVAYVKNAMLSWKPENFTLDFGLVKTLQFSLQENFWGYRYILKSFNDEYKFSPSADMGIIGKYDFSPVFSADLSITNGEGYKKLNKDNNYRYGAGITAKFPANTLFRFYYDLYTGKSDTTRNQHAFSFFGGYRHPAFYAGVEYNLMYNSHFQDNHKQYGYSIYTSVRLFKKISVFGRYDNLQSNYTGNDNSGQRILAGIQYQPIRYLKIAPNFSNWNPYEDRAETFLYLNVEFKL